MGMSVMSDVTLVPQKSDIWWVFLLQGVAGIIIGLMLITKPGATLVALTTVLGLVAACWYLALMHGQCCSRRAV